MKNTRAIAIELELGSMINQDNLAPNSAYDRRFKAFQRFNYAKGQINKAIKPAGLEADYWESDVGIEIRHKQPHRWSAAEANRLKKVCVALNKQVDNLQIEYDPEWNGLHVHVDVRDFTVKEMRNLMKWVQAIEPYIFKAVDPSRKGNWFCSTTKFKNLDRDYENVEQLVYHGYCKPNSSVFLRSTLERFKDDEKHACRFCGANFHSYLIRGSVEFRYFEATLDPKKLARYINFCYNLVMSAKRVPSKKVNEKTFKRLFQAI